MVFCCLRFHWAKDRVVTIELNSFIWMNVSMLIEIWTLDINDWTNTSRVKMLDSGPHRLLHEVRCCTLDLIDFFTLQDQHSTSFSFQDQYSTLALSLSLTMCSYVNQYEPVNQFLTSCKSTDKYQKAPEDLLALQNDEELLFWLSKFGHPHFFFASRRQGFARVGGSVAKNKKNRK